MRPHGSPAELERRRLRALELLQEGLQPHVVAQRLGVDRRSVRRWKRSYQRQGKSGLKAQPASGRPPQLTPRQRRSLVHCILKGPQAWGFSTALWTCRRIRQLIRERFHVVYHPDHIGRLLRSCGFTPQRPQTRAKERDDQRLRLWIHEEWSRAKKNSPPPGPPDQTGFLMSPLQRRTWAPRGVTPTLAVRQRRHEKVSAIGALVVSPHRRGVNLYLALHPKQNIRGPHVLRFLRHLRRHLPGPWLLWWDRGKPHRHQQGREYLQRHPQWQVEWLPPLRPGIESSGTGLDLPEIWLPLQLCSR